MTEPTNPNNAKTADAADRVEQGYLTGERAAFAADGATYVVRGRRIPAQACPEHHAD